MPASAPTQLHDLVDPDAKLTELAAGFDWTEGPTWSAATRSLCFNDIPGDTRWRWTAASGLERVNHPNFKANGQAYDDAGNLVVCEHLSTSVVRIDPAGRRETLAFQYRGEYLNSPNDLAIRPEDGSIYFTDPAYGRVDEREGLPRAQDLSFQGLFRIERSGGEPELLVDEDEFAAPNGLCFSPKHDLLYVNDTVRGNIKVWDVRPDGSLSNRRVLCDGVPGGPTGWFDGMECDELGNIWVTAPGGIWAVTPAGERIGAIATPEPAGSLIWGGDDLHSLFIVCSTTVQVVQTRVAGAKLPGNHVQPS